MTGKDHADKSDMGESECMRSPLGLSIQISRSRAKMVTSLTIFARMSQWGRFSPLKMTKVIREHSDFVVGP